MEFDRQKGVFITFKYTPFIFCHKMLLSYPQTSTSFTFQMKYYEFPSRASFDCKSRLHMIIDFIMRGNGVLLCKIQTHCNTCIYSQQNVLVANLTLKYILAMWKLEIVNWACYEDLVKLSQLMMVPNHLR